MQRGSLTSLVGLVALGALVAPASARPDRPPKVALRAGKLEIPGAPWTYSWSSGPTGHGRCSAVIADGIPVYDRTPLRVAKGVRRARIVFARARRPRRVIVRAHHHLGADGYPSGDGHRLPIRLRASRRSGEVRSWRAIIPLRPARRYYLDLHVAYRGRGRCGAGGGSMDLAFSLRTGPPLFTSFLPGPTLRL
jgi:hypothetical protein